MELIERAPFLDSLRSWLDNAATGRGRLVLLGGEAGVGKTALSRRFCDEIEGTARVLGGACDPLSTPRPLGPLLDIAAALGESVERWLRDPGQRPELFRAVLDALAAGQPSGTVPTVVVFEDVHWADEATLDLLRFLGRRLDVTHVMLIATFRDDEVGPRHPLRVAMGDLASSPAVRRLTLPPLSEAGVCLLAVGSDLDPGALYRQTGGNPFFVSEVLAARSAGIPASVRDAVLARAARLSPRARAALDAAAVIGSPIELSLLGIVSAEAAQAVDECLGSGVLRALDGVLSFRHELTRAAVLDAIPPARRRAIEGGVLLALEEAPEPERDPARLAHHAEGARDRRAVLEYAPVAARQAAALGAHREAAAQYARALRFAEGIPLEERAGLLEAHSFECYLTDQLERGIAARREAIAIWHGIGDRSREAINLSRTVGMLVNAGRNAEAEESCRAAMALHESLPVGRELVHVYATYAGLRMLNRDNARAITWGERAIALGERFGDVETLVVAENTVGSAKVIAGDGGGAAHFERSLELARAAGLDAHVARAYANLGSALGEVHRFALAERYLNEGIAYATERDLDIWRWFGLAWRALAHLYQGKWNEAAEAAGAVARLPDVSPVSRITALVALGRLRARRGDPEAMAALDQALELAAPTGTLPRMAPVAAARAEAAWLAGDRDRVRAEAQAIFDLAAHHRHAWFVGELGYWLWRAGAADAPPQDAAEPFALEIAGDWQRAAAAWDDLGCPYEAARACAGGDDPDALRRALTTFERLGARPIAAWTVHRLRELGARDIPRGPRPTTRAHPAGLTRRQVEIVDLLSAGYSNPEIAAALFLSPKTVEHHVSAILAKLGARSRAEAVERAVRIGLLAQNGGT